VRVRAIASSPKSARASEARSSFSSPRAVWPRCRQPALVRNARARIPAARPQQDARSATRGIRRLALAGSAFRGKIAQLPSADPFVLSWTWAAASVSVASSHPQCGLAHGAEERRQRAGRAGGRPTPRTRSPVARSDNPPTMRRFASGRTESGRGDRRRSPEEAGGECLRPRHCPRLQDPAVEDEAMLTLRFSGGDSPNAPRRSARSPCRSNRRSARARQPRPRGTRPG
jgi:hypothetical protein